MMKTRIIITGDSFTFGHGCSDRVSYYDPQTRTKIGNDDTWNGVPSSKCWPSLLQQQFPNFEVINLAVSGSDNVGMATRVVDYCAAGSNDNTTSIVIMQGSWSDRMEIADMNPGRDDCTTHWVMGWDSEGDSNSKFKQAKADFLKYLYNDKIGINRTTASILAVHSVSILIGANFVWSLPGNDHAAGHEILNQLKSNKISTIHEFDFSGVNDMVSNLKLYRAIDHHTNDLGHAKYLEMVIIPLLQRYGLI
jgi:hypothetical protein